MINTPPTPQPDSIQLTPRWSCEKISADHLQREAIVYIRQSSAQQVRDHRESTESQYALVDLAVAFGWPADRVVVIDDDLGKTAKEPGTRSGFQELLAEIAMGHVGLVLGIEMTRLARHGTDWHRLFDLSASMDTLLADPDGVYNPGDPNDRVLLGMKSIMSEFELHTLRGRLERNRLNKAHRGELFIAVPMGYLILPDGSVDLDPDEQVRTVVHLVFEKFQELGTAYAVFLYLRQNNIRLPIRPHTGPQRGQLQWRVATSSTVGGMLRHPAYAGAYVYGRRRQVKRGGKKVSQSLPQDQWKVFLPGKLNAYISWDQYEENQKRLRENRLGGDSPGIARGGPALLSGLLFCACGRKLNVHYHGRGAQDVYYECERANKLGRTDSCHGVKACVLDALLAQRMLAVLQPASLQLSINAAGDMQRERRRLEDHWQKQLQRADYEASTAERRYRLVDPENRLVARTLEQGWEEALKHQRQLCQEYARFQRRQPLPPSQAELASIKRLSEDIPALWHSQEVSDAERTQIVRCLLARVEVRIEDGSEHVDVTIHWQGGFKSQDALVRPVSHYTQLRDYDRLLDRVRTLRAQGMTATATAEQLNQDGFRSPRMLRFNSDMVRCLWQRCGTHDRSPDQWRLPALSRRLSVPETRLRQWLRAGWITGHKQGGNWIAWADADELERLSQLSEQEQKHGRFHPYPTELTTPKQSLSKEPES